MVSTVIEQSFMSKKYESIDFPSKTETVPKGNYLYLEDEPADQIFIVSEGRFRIASNGKNGKEVIKMIARQGDLIGEAGLIGYRSHKNYALALEESELKIIKLEEFQQQMEVRPTLALWVTRQIADRMHYFNRRLESMVFKDARSRIIDCLLHMLEHHGERVGYEWVVRKFITHQEIANLTATSRQTVTSVLNELRNEGLIKFNRRRLLINDLDGLKACL
jgi:CRP-like cAMP-binding protein